MAFAGPPKGPPGKKQQKPVFVRRPDSQWKIVQGDGWDPAGWVPPKNVKRNLATRGAKYRAAPTSVEPVYSDPMAEVPGGDRGIQPIRPPREIQQVWLAQMDEREAGAAEAARFEAAAQGRHLRQQAAWAEAERSGEVWRKQQAMVDLRRGLDAQVAEKKKARDAAMREDVRHGAYDNNNKNNNNSNVASAPLTVVRVHRGGPGGTVAGVRGGGGYTAGSGAYGTCPVVERITMQRVRTAPAAPAVAAAAAAAVDRKTAGYAASPAAEGAGAAAAVAAGAPGVAASERRGGSGGHEGHAGDHRRRRTHLDRGRFDSEGAAARAAKESLDDQRGKFGWG
jgi:hypothetical protein